MYTHLHIYHKTSVPRSLGFSYNLFSAHFCTHGLVCQSRVLSFLACPSPDGHQRVAKAQGSPAYLLRKRGEGEGPRKEALVATETAQAPTTPRPQARISSVHSPQLSKLKEGLNGREGWCEALSSASPRMPSCSCRSTLQASPTGLALVHTCMAASCTCMHKLYGTNTKMSTTHS